MYPSSPTTPQPAVADPDGRLTMSQPDPDPTPSPEGQIYRSGNRPGLSPTGVAVLGIAISLVGAVVSMLVKDSLGWIFGVPFVLVSAYCAWEVRPDSMRSALVMPPLVMLLIAVTIPIAFGEVDGFRDGLLRTLTNLTKLAPILMTALALSGAILAWRRWSANRRGQPAR